MSPPLLINEGACKCRGKLKEETEPGVAQYRQLETIPRQAFQYFWVGSMVVTVFISLLKNQQIGKHKNGFKDPQLTGRLDEFGTDEWRLVCLPPSP